MLSGTEIQRNLDAFSTKWLGYTGNERSGAQSFLNELFAAYGNQRDISGAVFEHHLPRIGFVDLFLAGVLIVEMKAPGVGLLGAKEQALGYWSASENAAAGIPKARYVVLSDFREFQVWEPGSYQTAPRATFSLTDIADHYDALAFLQAPNVTPVFAEHRRDLTTAAVGKVAAAYASMVDRSAAPPDETRRFITQAIWCMFAEDLGMLDGFPFQTTVIRLIEHPDASPAAELGFLFRVLNQKGSHNRTGSLSGTRYVNGELFAEPAEVNLNQEELHLLRDATEFDWRQVDPTIFGSLLEGVLGRERRWELGAHYTHEADILKIVEPVVTRPWRERIDGVGTPDAAMALLDELCAFRVLDPACGCGNFLYVAYRELRALESELKARIIAMAKDRGLSIPDLSNKFYRLHNLQGLDIERTAVQIARVTLWMGHRQMVERFGPAEDPLPLVDLSGIAVADALRVPWPETDVIIGNPPFLGSQWLRKNLGDAQVEWLKREFGVGVKDFCVYWFRRAHDHLKPGQRAGLVGTNSVSQNKGRSAALGYIVGNGGVVTDAVSSQVWPGDARVHVSIVSWIKVAPTTPAISRFLLDGVEVPGIDASLHAAEAQGWEVKKLKANDGLCFQGPIPVGKGFLIDETLAASLLAEPAVEYSLVVRPYLTGRDITNRPDQSPGRWTIDFGLRSLEEALGFPAALSIVRERVKPERDLNRDAGFRSLWWSFGRPRPEMRRALAPRTRWIGILAFGKRLQMSWFGPGVTPSGKIYVFAADDDFSMGVLLSRTHGSWAWSKGATLKGDLSYTPTSVFMTFPWPDPVTPEHREAVAEASRRLLSRRSELCLDRQIGLTKLYNQIDEGAWSDLAGLHKTLDIAVAAAYGWPASIAQDDAKLVLRLSALNREIVEGGRPYAPFHSEQAVRRADPA